MKELLPPRPKNARYVILGLLTFGILYGLSFLLDFTPNTPVQYGATFSKQQADHLGVNWQDAFIATLDDLHIDTLRLVAYWNDIEWPDDAYHFEDLDWQIEQVRKRGGSVTLAMGRRLPRWPECHMPDWAVGLSNQEQQEKILDLLPVIVERYKNDPTIVRWQVENEPLLPFFGECPSPDRDFLQKEVAVVREHDSRPIMITASGEFGDWAGSGVLGDVLGVSLYRIVWKPVVEHISYPLPPAFYALRQWYVRTSGVQDIILSELQAEAWSPDAHRDTSLQDAYKSMNPELLKQNVAFARRSGFNEIYFWGVEWWYWLKTNQNQPAMWETAKSITNEGR